MINQLDKIKCGYLECKKDNFSDIVAHAKDSHVDNPISLGKRKLDPVNQFRRITVVYKSINDLPEHTTSDVRLFADDSLLYRHIRNDEDAAA